MDLEVKITDIGEQDIGKVIALGTTTPEFNTGTNAPQFYSLDALKRWARDPNGLTLVATVDNDFAGFALGYAMVGPRDGYINCIVVGQNYRRMHIGKMLLDKMLDGFKRKGCNNVFGVVESENTDTFDFFRNSGFEIGKDFRYIQRTI